MKGLKNGLLISLILWLLIFATGAIESFATVYYVDTAGTNNATCGTTSGAGACATLSYLVVTRTLGTAGDTIQIAAGNYTDNTTMSIPVGVNVAGAGSATTTITTNQSKYIKLQSSVPCVDGSNEISRFNLTASTTNTSGILSSGRNNQKIHDMIFTGWTTATIGALAVYGKYGYDDTGGNFLDYSCTGGEPTCTWCSGVNGVKTVPESTDWATGVEIYNNTFTNSKLSFHVLQGALIHHNTIDNDNGTEVSGMGHTGYWLSNCKIYNNIINMNSLGVSTIALEFWAWGEETEFYNNTVSGWTSFVNGIVGKGAYDYSLKIYSNTFYVSKDMHSQYPFLEVNSGDDDTDGIAVYNNTFASSGSDRGSDNSIQVLARAGTLSNVDIKNNLFGTQYYGTERSCITVSSGHATSVIDSLNVVNNTFNIGANKIPIVLSDGYAGSVASNIVINNNIFNATYVGISSGGPAIWTPIEAKNNYFYNISTTGLRTSVNGVINGGAVYTDANNIFANTTPATIEIGDRTAHAATSDMASDTMICVLYTAKYTGTLGTAYLDKSGTNSDNAKVCVYADDKGTSDIITPTSNDTLVACSNAISSSTAGWNASDAVLGGNVYQGRGYWVCVIAGNNTWNRVLNTSTGTRYARTRTGYTGAYTSPPANLTGTWSDSGGYNRDVSAYVKIDSPTINTSTPGFVSSTDFHLQPGSPCQDTGTPIAGIHDQAGNTDFGGAKSPQRTNPSIGAYEYIRPVIRGRVMPGQ